MTIWNSKAIDIGERIHKRVMAEGGYMVHVGDKSFFEKYDMATGEFSRKFSDDLMRSIVQHRESLKVYAAWRRGCVGGCPRGIGSSGAPAGGQSPRAGVSAGATATRSSWRDVQKIDGGARAGGMVDGSRDGVCEGAGGGFLKFYAPHGATTGEEGGRK